jgi:glycosyltransferase involved in cell wall biosynthesis
MATASKLYDAVKESKVDIINVHYAIPHTAASYLAREMFKSEDVKLPIVTTVHGTDIHTLGQKKEFKSVVRFSLKSSDGITAVSNYLAGQTKKKFDVDQEVKVIYNHVDSKRFRKNEDMSLKQRIGGGAEDNTSYFQLQADKEHR